jgi:hypothetical protein
VSKPPALVRDNRGPVNVGSNVNPRVGKYKIAVVVVHTGNDIIVVIVAIIAAGFGVLSLNVIGMGVSEVANSVAGLADLSVQ